jgi:hypothetical protein
MKYFFALSILMVAGCSAPTNNNAPTAVMVTQNTLPPYSPGGIYYVAPGTFIGSWEATPFQTGKTDTNPCTVVITEADSIVSGTITNDYTHEILRVNGGHLSDPVDPLAPHNYKVHVVSSIGVSDSITGFSFWGVGDTVACLGGRFPQNSGQELWIFCSRQLPASK